ncbi:hypothetical protein FRC19_001620 [Serendipita sp. 401]|nr:hypothetical protein FRC19_001620 [Serendipita sp. 401]
MDPNPSGKRPFSFQKLLSANQSRGGLARQPFVPIVSKDASKSLDSSSTRVFTQKSRPLGLANADVEVGGMAKKPSGNAQSGPPVASQKQMFRGVSVGLQGFAPPEQRNFAGSTSCASAPSSSPSKLDDAQAQLEFKRHHNEESDKISRQPAIESVERQSSRPPVSQTRASLPGNPIFENDSGSTSTDPPPMDYAVFQSLVVSRSNAVRELKSKEKEVIELKNEIEALNIENEGLTARVEQLKTETRGYIQNCQNLLSTVQKEGKAFQEDAQEAYRRCIDDLRGGIPQVERISSELQEKMDEIQGTLVTEQQNKESIRGELLHQLEEAKHEADFLRDKLTIVMEDYQDAKSRIADLEQASLRDKVTLRQTLDLLETTRADIIILHNKPRRGVEDEDCIKAVEEQHQSKLNEYTYQVAQLQKDLSDSQNDIVKKQQELDRITFLLRASNEKVFEMEKISHQLEIKQALVHSKETELAILQVKYTEATAQLSSLQTINDENLQLKLELAEVSRRNDTLESKQSDYISACAEQRELTAEAEKELTALKNQYSDAKTRLEIVTADVQVRPGNVTGRFGSDVSLEAGKSMYRCRGRLSCDQKRAGGSSAFICQAGTVHEGPK